MEYKELDHAFMTKLLTGSVDDPYDRISDCIQQNAYLLTQAQEYKSKRANSKSHAVALLGIQMKAPTMTLEEIEKQIEFLKG